jgi:ornithine carbamoyltransferase
MTSAPKHFLDLDEVSKTNLRGIIDDARARKEARAGLPQGRADQDKLLDGRILAMIFEKPSTRTRVSFDVAMRQLGGETLLLNGAEMQLGRGESVADTARVLSRYVDAIMIRTTSHDKLLELAEYATVPVINGLTDKSHPCQLMADVLTFE